MLMIFLFLIFARPFICSLAFPYLNAVYSASLLAFLIIWLIYKGISKEKIANLKIPLILFILALLFSTLFTADKLNSLKELYKYITGLLIFLVSASLNNHARTRVIKAIILSAVIISLLAIYQYSFGFRHTWEYLAKDKAASGFTLDYLQRRRVFFPFVTPNVLGGYLAMILPLILALWNEKTKRIFKPLLFSLMAVSFALLLTKSLGALVSIFFGLLIYFYLRGLLDRKKILPIAGLMIVVGLVFFLRQTAAGEHRLPVFSLVMRLNYWSDTLRIIKTNPWWGLGAGNFNLAASRYAHNSYLQIWAEMGLLGIISVFWLIIIVFKTAIENIQNSPDKEILIGLIASSAIFLIHNLVDFSFFLPEIAIIWWVILGLTCNNN